MSKIKEAFAGGRALTAFITCGDPDMDSTIAFAQMMADAGADMLALGIPFSDPTAEGAVIEAANLRALAAGTTTDKVFAAVKTIRETVKIPLVLMTYANVVFSYGTERFAHAAAEVGADGVILPDIPFEEKDEFAPAFRAQGMDFISLAAPAARERITMIAREAEGFVYGVGAAGTSGEDVSRMMELVHAAGEIPVVVDLNPADSASAVDADGVMIRSVLMKLVETYGTAAAPYLYELVKRVKDAACGK